MSTCGECRAVIRWAVSSTSGKPMPLDPEPVERGNVVMTGRRSERGAPIIRVLSKDELAEPYTEPRYQHHRASCAAPRATSGARGRGGQSSRQQRR